MHEEENTFPISVDVLVHLAPLIDAKSYLNLSLVCKSVSTVIQSSLRFVQDTWCSNRAAGAPIDVYSLLATGNLFEFFVHMEADASQYHAKRNASHSSVLDHAVSLGKYNVASYLITKGFKPSVESEVMFDCIRKHDIRGASVLISSGMAVDRFRSRDDGYDILSCAVEQGSSEMVNLFLSSGVSIPAGILISAISLRDSESDILAKVTLLLDKGCVDPNTMSMNGHPAIQVAIQENPSLPLIELLVSRGADINKPSRSEGGGHYALDIADYKRRRNLYEYLEIAGGKHSLRYAVEREFVSIISLYIDLERTVKESDLAYLVCLAAASGLTSSLKTLVKRSKVDLNSVHVRDDLTPLHVAACRGHYSACKFLIEAGINASAKAHGGADIHRYTASLAGSPTWFQNFNLPEGALVPPPIRLKTAAELAREAGHDRLGKLIDLSVVEAVIARRDSMDSTISWPSTSGANSPVATGVVPTSTSAQSPTIVLQGLPDQRDD